MKKRIIVILAVFIVLISTALGGCATNKKVTLNVLNWGDYIEDSLISEFEKQYDWIDINYITVPSNEEMYVMISTEGSDFDMVFPSDYVIERLIADDMLHEINYDNIPNSEYLIDFCLDRAFDPGNKFSVPYAWGTLGILYNNTMVDTPTSWDVLWDEEYAGKIYMYDSMRDSIAVALKRLGYSVNTRDEAEIAEAVEILKAQKSLVQSYGGDEMRDSMINGSGALCVTYSGDAVFAMMENEELGYSVPEEGSNIWFDNMTILKTCDNPEAAEAFINFLLDPEFATINTEYIGYSSPNAKVLEMIDEEYMANNAFNPPIDVIENCEVFLDLGDFDKVYADAWQQVKWHTP